MIFNLQRIKWKFVLAAWIVFVFIQSLFFKFSNSEITQHIFGVIGEWLGLVWFANYGGYIIGIAELVASALLLSKLWPWGALLAFEIMCGAIVFHLFSPLGVVMPNFDSTGNVIGTDGGTLFVMACITWVSSIVLIVSDWTSKESRLRMFFPSSS